MQGTPVKTPKVAKILFPSLVWDIPSDEKTIFLTFDDGPTPNITDWVLDELNSFNAKATFFCVGENIKHHPHIFNRLIDEGHGIGNHTYNHLKGWDTKTKAYLKNIKKCDTTITQFAKTAVPNASSKLFRPPYGRIKRSQIKGVQKLGYKIVMWNVLAVDWNEKISQENCLSNVISNTKSGSIVVFHDSNKAARNMQYALPIVLRHFSDLGYSFKRIPE